MNEWKGAPHFKYNITLTKRMHNDLGMPVRDKGPKTRSKRIRQHNMWAPNRKLGIDSASSDYNSLMSLIQNLI